MRDGQIEQAIRRSHCSHEKREDEDHVCIGECHITRDGVTLACKACGSDTRPIAPSELLLETKLVKSVLDAIGIDWRMLTPEAKRRAAEVAKKWMEGRR